MRLIERITMQVDFSLNLTRALSQSVFKRPVARRFRFGRRCGRHESRDRFGGDGYFLLRLRLFDARLVWHVLFKRGDIFRHDLPELRSVFCRFKWSFYLIFSHLRRHDTLSLHE